MAGFDLLVLGDANPDLVLRGGDVKPVFGQGERLVDEALLTIGGSSAITACGAAGLGLRTAFVGVVGDDVFGHYMLDAMATRGVDIEGCVTDRERPTGVSVVLSKGEDRATLTSVGTIDALRADMIDRDLLWASRHVHTSSYFVSSLAQDLPRLFDESHERGLTTSLDPQGDPKEAWDGGLSRLLSSVDYFMPNGGEACGVAAAADVESAAATLAKSCAVVTVKLGAGGGLAREGEATVRASAPRVDVVDSTGAGDSFDAGFLAARLQDWPLERSLQLAVACGSLATRAVGGTESQPTMEEALAAMDEMS